MILQYISSFYKAEYFRQNKTIILLLFAWLFRLCFLTQANYGMAINKYVLFQIVIIFIILFVLCKKRIYPTRLLSYISTRFFALIYILGMISLFWSVKPFMSCYFALENLVCMTALLYLSTKCRDQCQLECFFIGMVIAILLLFFLRAILAGEGFHSVTHSTVAAMLTTYCLGEWNKSGRPRTNVQALNYGLGVGLFFLAITTSGGAIFSTFLACLTLVLFSNNRLIRIITFLFFGIIALLWFSGYNEAVLSFLFPGKSLTSISTAHGRTYIWNLIYEKIAERPWLGWGYAAVERILPLYCTDAHNSLVGIRGALGNIGFSLLILSMVVQFFFLFKNREVFGYKGLMTATVCAFFNSNTTNFLAAKAGSSSLTFAFLLVLGAAYSMLPFHYEEISTLPRGYNNNL